MVDPYTWSYEDILQPRRIMSNNMVYYYLFHVAPIYNWLRKVESDILSKYVEKERKDANASFGQNKKANGSIQKFQAKGFET